MSNFFDSLETRAPEEREATLMASLPRQIAYAKQHSTAMHSILADIDADQINSRSALANLPVTRKSELLKLQQASRAAGGDIFGGFAAQKFGRNMSRIFASPGPVYEPGGTQIDYWRTARSLYAAGFREGDLVHNTYSYHMTPGAFIFEAGAIAIGSTVFPAGTGHTEQQLQAISELKPNAYLGTPSFLRILIEKALASNTDISSLKKAVVSAEPFPPSLCKWFTEQGVTAYQTYATADVGLIAYETEAREGLVVDEGIILEIVRPGTNDPVPEGEVGEVVVTVLNPVYPLVRFGTGDLSAVMPGLCPTGRSNTRIKGWMGRADQTTKVRGIFVHPSQVMDVIKRFPEITRGRLVVSGEMANDKMTLAIECNSTDNNIAERVSEAVRDVTKLRADIKLVSIGSLPNDGKVIEDDRSYN